MTAAIPVAIAADPWRLQIALISAKPGRRLFPSSMVMDSDTARVLDAISLGHRTAMDIVAASGIPELVVRQVLRDAAERKMIQGRVRGKVTFWFRKS